MPQRAVALQQRPIHPGLRRSQLLLRSGLPLLLVPPAGALATATGAGPRADAAARIACGSVSARSCRCRLIQHFIHRRQHLRCSSRIRVQQGFQPCNRPRSQGRQLGRRRRRTGAQPQRSQLVEKGGAVHQRQQLLPQQRRQLAGGAATAGRRGRRGHRRPSSQQGGQVAVVAG